MYELDMITTVRHELGHTAGLSHGTSDATLCNTPQGDDAMTSDLNPIASLAWTDYNAHHRAHIDDFIDSIS